MEREATEAEIAKMDYDEEVAQRKEEQEEARAEGYGYPRPEVKHNVHTFLNTVLETPDTTKVGNLTPQELGMPRLPLRSDKELELFAREVMHNDFFALMFKQSAENTVATSLSKDAKLINLAVMQKRIIADETKPKTVNRGWFSSKNKTEGEIQQ